MKFCTAIRGLKTKIEFLWDENPMTTEVLLVEEVCCLIFDLIWHVKAFSVLRSLLLWTGLKWSGKWMAKQNARA